MHIGIAFDLKPDAPAAGRRPGRPARRVRLARHRRGHRRRAPRARATRSRELGDGRPFLEAVLRDPPDLVFNFAEGTGVSRSREARVPAVCEMLGIPYTGSDPLTLAVALDKDMTRRLGRVARRDRAEGDHARARRGDVRRRLRRVPADAGRGRAAAAGDRQADVRRVEQGHPQPLPDPHRRRSSARPSCELWQDYQQPVLVEEFIAGDEVTVGIVGNDPPQSLGVMRVVPKQPAERLRLQPGSEAELAATRCDYECPAKLPPDVIARGRGGGAGGVRGARLPRRGPARLPRPRRRAVLPGDQPAAGAEPGVERPVFLAYRMGLTYPQLIGMILDAAVKRCRLV